MKKSNFSDWSRGSLTLTFGLNRLRNHPILDDWLNVEKTPMTDFEKQYISFIQNNAIDHIDSWNEMDLREQFIGPLFTLCNFYGDTFRYFAAKKLSGTIGKHIIGGEVDAMIAWGIDEPQKPYFLLSEYKPEKQPNKHPFGQTLAAMLIAQEHNQHKFPVFGSYIIGRNLYFLVLDGLDYAVSLDYSIMRDDIYDIFFILKKLKSIIENLVTQEDVKELIESIVQP